MCQARVILVRDDQEQEVMQDVILVEQTPEGVHLHAFFEEPRTLAAEITRIDLLKHRVYLIPKEVMG